MWGGGEDGNTSPHFINFKYLLQDFASLKSIDLATGQCYKTIILGTEKVTWWLTIIHMHSWSICVEYPRHSHLHVILNSRIQHQPKQHPPKQQNTTLT